MQALVGPVTTGAAVAVSGEIADDMLMTPFSADDEKNADFVKAYKAMRVETVKKRLIQCMADATPTNN